MGDDLAFARNFTRTAAEGLELLVNMDNPRAKHAEPVVMTMMTTIQRGAKRLRARHVYMAAQDVLTALHRNTDDVLNQRIHTLGNLVTGYAKGLGELDVLIEKESAPKTIPDKWEAARDTLDGLLTKSTPAEADMLSRLMRAPVTIDTVHPETNIDPVEADIIVLNAKLSDPIDAFEHQEEQAVLPTKNPTVQITDRTASDDIQIPLESLMRDVVADALSVARSIGRTISLSYDMGEVQIDENKSDSVRTRLGGALSQIIHQALQDDRAGHIDINVAGNQIHIMAGLTAMRVAIDPEQAQSPSKPRISVEVEQGLRTQLAALLDSQDTIGAAS